MPHDNDRVVRLSVLIYLLAGCDFLPAMSGLPFEIMWVVALQSVRVETVFKRPLFLQEGEVWMVNMDECIKLVATMIFSKNEAAFRRGGRTAGDILADVKENVQDYIPGQVTNAEQYLPQTQNDSDWAWTQNSSVALAPGPHVVTLCFVGKALVNNGSLTIRRF
ncbi:unnamed protein product [Pylaiella littoralis]